MYRTAWEAFTLDYTVKFPLSLVISRKTILRYQLLFRHLLQLKHAERVLAETWTEHTKSPLWRKRSGHAELETWKMRVFGLRARMFAFIQQMYSFAVSGVLEHNWAQLEKKMDKVETVDQLLRDHVDFLDTCLKECLLTNEKLLTVSASTDRMGTTADGPLTLARPPAPSDRSFTASYCKSAPSSRPTRRTLLASLPQCKHKQKQPAVTGLKLHSKSSGISLTSASLRYETRVTRLS